MPSTLVHLALAGLLGAALLGPAFDARALAVVFAAVAFADLDAVLGVFVGAVHRAAFHTLLLPLAAAALVYYDTRVRDGSWLRTRYDDRGVRVAWVTILAFVVSAVGLDALTAGGVNLLFPVYDQFVHFTGQLGYSTREGFVQTFVEVGPAPLDPTSGRAGVDVGQRGSTREVHVDTGVNPSRGAEPADVRRVFPVVRGGWQLIVTLTGAFVVAAKLVVARADDRRGADR